MSSQHDADGTEWLSLSQAAAQLGVHAATLRRWADKGSIAYMVTPGGHRRFAVADLETFQRERRQIRPKQEPSNLWAEQALTRTRQGIAQQGDQAWMMAMSDDHRQRHRLLGRQLMALTLQYISSDEEDALLVEEAQIIGRKYGRINREINMPLSDALMASMFFRDELVEVAMQLPESTRIRPSANTRLMRRINTLLNAVHLAIAAEYEAGNT